MSLEVKFSPRAEKTFEDIVIQLRNQWGEKFVNKFKDKVSRSLEIISLTPFIYPIAKENEELRKCVLHKNCSMLYRIKNDIIEVLYFWDNRQDPLINF